MKNELKALKIPDSVCETFSSIIALIEQFSKKHLNDDYLNLCKNALTILARKKPSPILKGKENIWACAIIYTIGQQNFLFDKTQKPHISSQKLRDSFDCAESTISTKSKMINQVLKIFPFDSNWMIPSLIDESPMVWFVKVNGFIVDIRTMPRDIQEQAYEKGIIPYIPNDKKNKNI